MTKDNIQQTSLKKSKDLEFGGKFGVTCVMVFSHVILFVMASTLFGTELSQYLPTWRSCSFLLGYHISQFVPAQFMPGLTVKGLSDLGYLCNGYLCFYSTIGIALALHYTELVDLTMLVTEYPSLLTTSVLLGDFYSWLVYYFAESFDRFKVEKNPY